MSDIFISYKKTDHARVRPIVDLLQEAGWSVWWDTRLNVGEQWDVTIERAITSAGCVVVVWSAESIDSYWVSVEGSVGRERGVLIPVLIQGASPPFGYNLIQAIDFTDGTSGSSVECAAKLVRAVELKIGPPGSKPIASSTRRPLRSCAIRLSVRLLATTVALWASAVFSLEQLNYAGPDPWWTRQVFLPLPFVIFGLLFLLSVANSILLWNAHAPQIGNAKHSKMFVLSVFRKATLWLACQRGAKHPSYAISLLFIAVSLFSEAMFAGPSRPLFDPVGLDVPSWVRDWIIYGWSGWPAFMAAVWAVLSVGQIAIKSHLWSGRM